MWNIIENKSELVFSIATECDVKKNNELHIFDKKINNNKLICASNTFMAEVLEERALIYPGQNVSMEMVFMFFMDNLMNSVLQSIETE